MEHRNEIVAQNVEMKHTMVNKVELGRMWRELSESWREVYNSEYRNKKKQHSLVMRQYKEEHPSSSSSSSSKKGAKNRNASGAGKKKKELIQPVLGRREGQCQE